MFRVIVTAFAAVMILPAATRGVVQTLDATVTARVEQMLPPDVVNTDTAYEQLGDTTGNLPLLADARLIEGGYPDSGAGASARLADPRLAQTADPAEIGLAAVANSHYGPSSWIASGSAGETRQIVFTAGEIGEPEGTALVARSYFFLDGVLVLWHQAGGIDLTDAAAEIAVRVEQTTTDDPQPVAVLAASMTLTGQPDGTAVLAAAGSLVPENAVLFDISDLVPQLGTVQLVVLPKLAIPYEYAARVGQAFTLEALVDARIDSPSRAGAAVVVGPSLEDITALLSDVAGADVGGPLAAILDTFIKAAPVPARPLTAAHASTTVTVAASTPTLATWPGTLCGLVGAEAMIGMALGAGCIGLARRRGR